METIARLLAQVPLEVASPTTQPPQGAGLTTPTNPPNY